MTKSRKPHPADIANDAIVANAVRFEIALFLGVGRYAKGSAATAAAARAEADRLSALHPNGRHPLIYAIDANGRSALVTDSISTEDPEGSMKTYAKKFNAQRAARAAGHDPDSIEIVKTKNGFSWRAKADHAPAKTKPAAKKAKANGGGKRAAISIAAKNGKLPEPPDFSAPTHTRFRAKLAKLIDLAKAGDIEGLKAIPINPVSTSPKAMARYRDLCVEALEARSA